MITVIASSVVAIAAWFAVNFLGKPILALREKRLQAIEVAERYFSVGSHSSDEVCAAARKSLNENGCTLRAYNRESSIATRLWCWLFHYDLEGAARCLFGLAQVAGGHISVFEKMHKDTLNALYVSLGATGHLSPQEIETVNQLITEAKGNLPE
jgi:hypothetical protein